jgi:hypothetical protein
MTSFCKTTVPQEVWDELRPIKDDDEAVKNWGILYMTKLCRCVPARLPACLPACLPAYSAFLRACTDWWLLLLILLLLWLARGWPLPPSGGPLF